MFIRCRDAFFKLEQASTVLPHVVTVTGPPGYGKTTTAAAWFSVFEAHKSWLTLDSRDNDELRFFSTCFQH